MHVFHQIEKTCDVGYFGLKILLLDAAVQMRMEAGENGLHLLSLYWYFLLVVVVMRHLYDSKIL